jgi:FAD-dependent urate hydroxylase
LEGPWVTYARMITLRTPKDLTSIDLGVPSLTFRAWWEAQYGEEGWNALDKIPRAAWMEYLRWFRATLNLPVQNGVKVLRIDPQPDGVHHLHVRKPDGESIVRARKVILATGIQGGGEWHIPAMIKESLPPARYAHTSEMVDYAALAGKRIGILGGGASAFDNAQCALSLGVAEAHVFVRRNKLPQVNPIRFLERWGLAPRFASFDDASKYKMMAAFFHHNQPPTNDTFTRAAAWPGFSLHLGAPWLSVKETPSGVEVTTPKGTHELDFLVLSTGLLTDPALRPELSQVAHRIAKWSDRYAPPRELQNPLLDDHPYLGQSFEFLPRTPDDAKSLYGLFAFNYSALISLGLSASALSGLRYAIPRLAEGVANQLVVDKKDDWIDAFIAFDEAEFVSEWTPLAGMGAS